MISFPDIDPVVFSIPIPSFGELPVRWYALAYVLGFVLGNWWFVRLSKKYVAKNLTVERVDSLFIWIVIGVILGGRFGFILFYNLPFYIDNPVEIIKTWQGGMSFHGGLIGVVLAVLLFGWKYKINPIDVGDRLAPSVCFGLFFGRLANFINGELWGRVTDVSWAMVFPRDVMSVARHPSQLYEAGLEGLLLFSILFS